MELIYKHERSLFTISMIIGALVWLAFVVVSFGIGLVYGLFFLLLYLFVQSAFISHLRGNAVELSDRQFPDLYTQYREAGQKVGMDDLPTAYVMMSDGVLNAMATRFLRRHYVVVYSSVIDALRSKPEALRFYFGHELAHIKRGHLKLGWLRWPASILPLLGAGYRRAQEYTCDLHGLAASNSRGDALAALGVLASGGEKLAQLNFDSFIEQQRLAGGFWMSYHELTNDYPWLCKRLAHVAAAGDSGVGTHATPRRNFFAWILAAVTPRLGIGGGGTSIFLMVAIVGILAAIAIPAYQDYTLRSRVMLAMPMVDEVKMAATSYVEEHRAYPKSPADVGLPETLDSGPIQEIRIVDGGF
jgi:Zn-dependent protease with chaperone function